MMVSQERRSMFKEAHRLQRRISVSSSRRRSVHEATTLARMPSGIDIASDCRTTWGVTRRKISDVS